MVNAYLYEFLLPKNNAQLKKIISKDCDFYNGIIKTFLNSEFISNKSKKKLNYIKC